ncbi:MAG: septum formation protein Maf [Thermoproteales archaeon]|nr:septum formation protein Maf [Thermoproteales archaeon]
MNKIVLASKSDARRSILEQIGFKVIVCYPKVSEIQINHGSPEDVINIAKENSFNKAMYAKKCYSYPVISADTLIFQKSKIFGKPRNKEEAKNMLISLRGTFHRVVTGYTILYKNDKITGYDITEVYMRNYSEEEINYYLKTNEWIGKAGSYAIQGIGAFLVKRINGCYYNVVGLPLSKLIEDLKILGLWPP